MAYLHCHNCDFNQDDYWSEDGWNPVKSFESDKDTLLSKDLDEVVHMDSNWLREHGRESVTRRDLVVLHLRQIIACVEGMVYRTPEELLEKNPERRCPKCGKQELDVD